MRIKESLALLALIFPLLSIELKAQDYAIEELRDEETVAARPFSISRVLRFDGGLRLFLATGSPDAIANLIASGSLQAQLSDQESESGTVVALTLGKAVWCSAAGDPVYLSFGDPLPACDGNQPARIAYFLETNAVLGPGRDLAIGQDPDFLWLIEER
jgi:hypothetical protein